MLSRRGQHPVLVYRQTMKPSRLVHKRNAWYRTGARRTSEKTAQAVFGEQSFPRARVDTAWERAYQWLTRLRVELLASDPGSERRPRRATSATSAFSRPRGQERGEPRRRWGGRRRPRGPSFAGILGPRASRGLSLYSRPPRRWARGPPPARVRGAAARRWAR